MSDTPTPETDAVAAIEGNWDTKALRMTAKARALEHERDAARAELAELRKDKARLSFLIGLLKGLMNESTGVAGWHLNGDIASWEEIDLPLTAEDIDAAMTQEGGNRE